MRFIIFFLPIFLFAELNLNFNSTYLLIKGKYGLTAANFKGYLIESELEIYGFNKDGLLYFIKKEPNEDRDYNIATAYVINLKNNALILRVSYNFKGKFSNFLKQNEQDLKKIAKDFNISKINEPTLKEFPFNFKNLTYKLAYDKKYYLHSRLKESFLTNCKISLKKYSDSFLLYKNTIFNKEYEVEDWVYNIYALGAVKSSKSEEFALILAKVYRGFEGKPHVLDLFVIGFK
jgi:hypothetical protein